MGQVKSNALISCILLRNDREKSAGGDCSNQGWQAARELSQVLILIHSLFQSVGA